MNNLATTYIDQGKYAEAEKLHKQCLQKFVSVLGSNHPDTLRTICSIGDSYIKQGKYDEAEAILKDCRDKCKTVLGANAPLTNLSLHLLEQCATASLAAHFTSMGL